MSANSEKSFIFADTENGGIIHVANIKGGVGKSTVATNLAAALANKGPTLLIDLDVQGSATVALGKNPAHGSRSSWDLFSRRFSCSAPFNPRLHGKTLFTITRTLRRLEEQLFGLIVGKGEVTDLIEKVDACLDIIPGGSPLFKTTYFYHIQNFHYNLELCRNYYKYIVLDTPSVWNRLTRMLYGYCSINLIPVTLSALSTKSLKDYLTEVRRLAEKNSAIKIRIVKNEVFGHEDSKVKGKTRTMSENRKFLDSLCETVVHRNEQGVAILPQSILFELEIPESAIVRDAQDEGKPVHLYHQYAAITKAFDELAKCVQYVLNTSPQRSIFRFWENHARHYAAAFKTAAALLFFVILGSTPAILYNPPPRPIAPQQLVESGEGVVRYISKGGESLYKIAKYSICHFRAMVPSNSEVTDYLHETIELYNKTRLPHERHMDFSDYAPAGLNLNFYPPAQIVNPLEKQLLPVYKFFAQVVGDPYAYVTGDWCVRGTGGGQPHYGIDVAARLGEKIISPTDGLALLRDSEDAGHIVGIVKEGTALFFCHMDRRFVASGDTVHKGQVIGTIGLTGHTSGPHVHVGYGIRAPSQDGINFGKSYYKLTDPKLFFYREVFLNRVAAK